MGPRQVGELTLAFLRLSTFLQSDDSKSQGPELLGSLVCRWGNRGREEKAFGPNGTTPKLG